MLSAIRRDTPSTTGRGARRRSTAIALGTATAVAAAAVLTTGGGPAGAASPVSQATGRFLSGSAQGTSFDSVLALNGEQAQYPGDPGPNANDLSGSVLGQTLSAPTKNISIPIPGGINAGAVGQYAKANANGSATASSGLIGSNGAINAGGSGNSDLATLDLSQLPGASTLTALIGNLKLTVGAVSARAQQAAFGDKLADPAKGCTGGSYSRVSDADQAGHYQFANLTLSATSPLLQQLGTSLTGALGSVLSQLAPVTQLLGVSGLPTAAELKQDLTVDIFDGGVTASAADGSFTVDLAKILQYLKLDLNDLCPNTSLVPYLARALEKLPAALEGLVSGLVDQLTTALGKATIQGQSLPKSVLDGLVGVFSGPLGSFADTANQQLDPVFTKLTDALDSSLLSAVVNAQSESGHTFTVTALRLNLLPGGSSLPTLPGLPSIPGVPAAPLARNAQAAKAQAQAHRATTSSPSPSAGHSFAGFSTARFAAPLAAPRAETAAGDPALQLNLASATVTNNRPAAAPSTTASSGNDAAADSLPTGVPAGQALRHDGGTPTLPLVLVLLGMVVAAGGTLMARRRARPGR